MSNFLVLKVSQSSKISVLPMSVINFFDSSLNNLLRLVQVLQDRLLVRVSFELLNQLFVTVSLRFVSCCWTRRRYAWKSEVNVAAAGFSVTSRYALVVWGFSCFLVRLILLSPLRIRLQKNSRQPWRLEYFIGKLLLSLHAYRFPNTNRKQCVLENDCVWSCVLKLQLSLLSELDIAPIHLLRKSPSICVWFVQIVLNFFHTLTVHRIHSSEKHGLPIPFETSSSWVQSTSDSWMYFNYISDVIKKLGEVLWQQCIVLQWGSTRLPPECPWIALKYRKCLEELGLKHIETFSLVLLL